MFWCCRDSTWRSSSIQYMCWFQDKAVFRRLHTRKGNIGTSCYFSLWNIDGFQYVVTSKTVNDTLEILVRPFRNVSATQFFLTVVLQVCTFPTVICFANPSPHNDMSLSIFFSSLFFFFNRPTDRPTFTGVRATGNETFYGGWTINYRTINTEPVCNLHLLPSLQW